MILVLKYLQSFIEIYKTVTGTFPPLNPHPIRKKSCMKLWHGLDFFQ